MTFTVTANIKEIDKLNDKFFKVLLQDERSNHIIVNVPVEKASELALNTKINVWGNVSAFQYQSKWYNNLFAQTVVPESKKFLLIQKEPTDTETKSRFVILEYGSEIFSEEYIKSKYKKDKQQEVINADENINTVFDKLAVKMQQLREEKKLLVSVIPPLDFVSIEYSHLQNSVSKKLITIENNAINLLTDTYFFVKKQAKSELLIFHKVEATDVNNWTE